MTIIPHYINKNDLAINNILLDAEKIITETDIKKDNFNINEIITLYNINYLLNNNYKLNTWLDSHYQELKNKSNSFMNIINKDFFKLLDKDFNSTLHEVDSAYINPFWEIFSRNKLQNKIHDDKVAKFLQANPCHMPIILKYKNLVNHYHNIIKNTIVSNPKFAYVIIHYFLEDNTLKYNLPSFTEDELNNILKKYISLDYSDINIDHLKLLTYAKITKNFPIDITIQVEAKKRYDNHSKMIFSSSPFHGFKTVVYLAEQSEIIKSDISSDLITISYDKNWLTNHLDYPTILNSFIYVFGMTDFSYRSLLLANLNEDSILEKILSKRINNYYPENSSFIIKNDLAKLNVLCYYSFLQSHNINLEDVFSWFFNTYIQEEFQVSGFYMQAPTSQNYADKFRALAPELESVLKDFNLFVEYGCIDESYRELSGNHQKFESLPSLISNKYAYILENSNSSNDLKTELNYVFSPLFFNFPKINEVSLFKILTKTTITTTDFTKEQMKIIDWLINRDTLILEENNVLRFNMDKLHLLNDLYQKQVICIQYLTDSQLSELKKLKDSNEIEIGNTLFSKYESRYINYLLNKAQDINGLDLRNRYIHGNNSRDPKQQKLDYLFLLIVMILTIIKINEELILNEKNNNVLD